MDIKDILTRAVKSSASDVHLTVGRPPIFRINGVICPQNQYPILTPEDTKDFFEELRGETSLELKGELDFVYSLSEVGRFRINAFYQNGSIAIALRLLSYQVPTLEQLDLPPVLADLTSKNRGLILVTGPTGSGKTTTLAALIDHINSERSLHILTLEDPIEYIHQPKKSIINQREIGTDSQSFAVALRAALRQDPDVILVGEMRDLETISIAITAAETGHLVFSTLHTSSTVQAIDRIIDAFPPYHQQQIRIQLADTLQGIVAQQLLPRADGKGRVVAAEILVPTPAIKNLIREGKTYQIPSLLQTGAKFGMQTMDMALKKLQQSGQISYEEYFKCLNN